MNPYRRQTLQTPPESARHVAPDADSLLAHLYALANANTSASITFEDPSADHALVLRKTWTELFEMARHRADRFEREAGIQRGDRVLLALSNGLPFVESFFALWILGAIPVPLVPPSMLERKEAAAARAAHIARDTRARHLLTRDAWLTSYRPLLDQENALEHLLAVDDTLPIAAPSRTERDLSPDPSQVALLQYTSGSTASPRGVQLTHANLLANTVSMGTLWGVHEEDVAISWIPLYHDLGLIGQLLTSLCWRMPMVLLSTETFLREPFSWLDAISRFRGTITHAPNFALARCTRRISDARRATLDLSCWRDCILGGEFVELEVTRAFSEKFAPVGFDPRAISPAYGLAEATVGVTHRVMEDPHIFDQIDRDALARGEAKPCQQGGLAIANVGSIVPGVSHLVVDEDGALCKDRQVGELWLAGESITRGYWENEDASAAMFATHPSRPDVRWLRTGDLVYMVDGRLHICGRTKEVIIVRGRNYYPTDFERAAERVEDVRKGGTVAFSHREEGQDRDHVVMLCETKADLTDEALVAAIRASVAEDTGLMPDIVQLAPPYAIPKTSSGKRQRALARKLWLQYRETT